MKNKLLGVALALFFALPAFAAWDTPALVATTGPVIHFGLQSIDGVSCGIGARVLDKDATAGATRGIWVVSSGSWTRATDADADAEVVNGNTILILYGIANHGKTFQLSTSDPITLGSTSLTFTDITSSVILISRHNTFTSATASPILIKPASAPSANTKLFDMQATGAGTSNFYIDSEGDCTANSFTGNVTGNASTATMAKTVPINAQTSAYGIVAGDAGKCISITTGGVTVSASTMSAGDIVSIWNNSGSNQTITQGSGVTIYLVGTATTGNRTLAQRGLATLLCITGGASPVYVISGGGLS